MRVKLRSHPVAMTQVSEALKFRVDFETICDQLASYSPEQLRYCVRHRVLLLQNGNVAICATTRLENFIQNDAWFDEIDFHSGLLRCRRDALLHFATFDLCEKDYSASAQSRFVTRQLVFMALLAATIATIFSLAPITHFMNAICLGFSLFFFTLVMMRLVCLLALKKVLQP